MRRKIQGADKANKTISKKKKLFIFTKIYFKRHPSKVKENLKSIFFRKFLA